MATQKYLVKVDYECLRVKMGGEWFVFEGKEEPKLGTLKGENFLPNHDCRRYYDSQSCDEDDSCYNQQILEIKPFSEQEARRLGAKSTLEDKCKAEK